MKRKKFNPQFWLNQENIPLSATPDSVSDLRDDFKLVLSRIESSQTDITASYADWRDIGFAFADEFGEGGRDYFHRISRFYPGYSPTGCDKQYDNCLKSTGHGITIKTVFHLAKQAGINISPGNSSLDGAKDHKQTVQSKFSICTGESDKNLSETPGSKVDGANMIFNTPRLPPEIYANLPDILSESCDLFGDAVEKDVLLISSIAVLSGCLPNISGIYFDEPHSAHLYAFITAPAGSGKGRMKWSRYWGQTIHDQMVLQAQHDREIYESELDQYNNLTRKERQGVERPQEPLRKMFYIPANSSSSAFIQALADNNFSGVIFETEADTLSGTFKQEWGNFSDVLRKAFHHESTSMFRRKDNEFIEIKDPHMAIALSGTPRQVRNMMPDTENGLFSRFLYYAFEDNSEFKNPFVSHRSLNYTAFFIEKGKLIFDLYEQLNRLQHPLSFQLTEKQGQRFTATFNEMLSRNKLLLGNDFDANIKRLGLITFRIAMVLTGLRILEDGELTEILICSNLDFETAMTMAITLEKHAIAVFNNLPGQELKGTKLKFYETLPDQFDRQGYLKVAANLGINPKTAEKYISLFRLKLLNHEHNQYSKITTNKPCRIP